MGGGLLGAIASSSRCTLTSASTSSWAARVRLQQPAFESAGYSNGRLHKLPLRQQCAHYRRTVSKEKPAKKSSAKVATDELEIEGLPTNADDTDLSRHQPLTLLRRHDDLSKFKAFVAKRGIPPNEHASFPHMPDKEDWPEALAQGKGFIQSYRRILSNKDTIAKIIEQLDLPGRRAKLADPSQGLTVLEGYAGSGTITRALLADDNVGRVIAIEDVSAHLAWLTSLLHDKTLEDKTDKLTVVHASSFKWATYRQLVASGELDNVEQIRRLRGKEPDYSSGVFGSDGWKEQSPLLFFITVPNSVHGEQLFVQLIQSIMHRVWLFRYARVTLCFVCAQIMAERCIAEPGSKKRNRISVISQSLATPKIVLDSSHFRPVEDHFWPSGNAIGPRLLRSTHAGTLTKGNVSSGQSKSDQCLVVFEPLEQPLVSGVEAEAFEYMTRHLFVLKTQPIETALKHMMPGAGKLIDVLNEGTHPALRGFDKVTIDPKTKVNELTVTQLVALARIFERWPFRPEYFFADGLLDEIRSDRDT